jgi:hypothetical protein
VAGLKQFRHSVHSQNGEDGILAEVFRRIGITNGTFCEFGAWDGKHLSNCYALYELGWSGFYIEGNSDRFEDLRANVSDERVEPILAYVRTDGDSTLEAILARTRRFQAGQTSLDLLSIDIDSDDLAVWRSVKTLRPKVVIIEFNPTIPLDVIYENSPKGANRGNSARAIYELALIKNYDFVSVVGANMIFVDRHVDHNIPTLNILDTSIEWGARYFFGYDGTMLIASPGTQSVRETEVIGVPWAGGAFVQPVPRMFRTYDLPAPKRLFWIYVSYVRAMLTSPISTLKAVIGRMQQP